MIKSTPLKIRSFRVYSVEGSKGDSYIFDLPISGFLTDIANISIWADGTLETDLLDGDGVAQQYILTKKYRYPLDTSIDENKVRFNKLVLRYTCISDSFKYYCVSNKDGSAIFNAKVLKPSINETVEIPANTKNFLAVGRFKYKDTIVQGPCEILESETVILTVLSDRGLLLLQR